MSEFERALAKVLIHEGGFSNHPKDPGGATMKGVTQRVYDTYRKGLGLAARSVKMIDSRELQQIYRSRYWNLIKGDALPPGVSYVVFDGAVNSGVSQSVKWLQRALGVNADGVIGPATLNAVAAINDQDALIVRICERRMAFLRALKTWKTFGKGWTSRVNDVRDTGIAWAAGAEGPDIAYDPSGEGRPKARVEDAKAAPSTAPGDTAAGGGTISVVISQAQEQLTPYVNIGFVAKAVAILTIGGVVVAIGGLAWRWYAKRKAAERADALDLPVPA